MSLKRRPDITYDITLVDADDKSKIKMEKANRIVATLPSPPVLSDSESDVPE